LLEKMGWQEGRSLGKTNAGLLEPLKVTVKTDRKGENVLFFCHQLFWNVPR